MYEPASDSLLVPLLLLLLLRIKDRSERWVSLELAGPVQPGPASGPCVMRRKL